MRTQAHQKRVMPSSVVSTTGAAPFAAMKNTSRGGSSSTKIASDPVRPMPLIWLSPLLLSPTFQNSSRMELG